MHIYATKHGQISRKNSFCAPLFAERRIASIFDFIFDFWYANNLRLKFKKVKLVLRLKRRFSTIFVLPDLSFSMFLFYQSSPSFSLAGTSIILGLSMILAVLLPFSTIPIIQAWYPSCFSMSWNKKTDSRLERLILFNTFFPPQKHFKFIKLISGDLKSDHTKSRDNWNLHFLKVQFQKIWI